MKENKPLQLVIFDWAGTTIDHGCCAPAAAFVKGFQQHGVEITMAQARKPMGMGKRDHIAAVGEIEEVRNGWLKAHGNHMEECDIDNMYQSFVPLLLDVLVENSGVISGVRETVKWLRQQGLKVGATTGYFEEAAEIVRQSAAAEDYAPDCSICATNVSKGRPAPWMIYRVMEELSVLPPRTVVNVGDTIVDIESARNTGVWAIGVARTGNLCGLSLAEFNSLPVDIARTKVSDARRRLREAGAHYAIDAVTELPQIIKDINYRLENGDTP